MIQGFGWLPTGASEVKDNILQVKINDNTSFNTLYASEVGSTLRTNTPCPRQKK